MSRRRSRRFQILSWSLFDFANSSFTTVIVTVVFANYFAGVIVTDGSGEQLWNIALVISNLFIVFTAPVIGAIADSTRKKTPLSISYVVCVVCTAGLFFMGSGMWLPAIILFVIANIAYASGENLVAGLLPDLAEKDEMGRISAYGWAMGYGGGLCALLICLPLAMTERDDLIRATTLVVAVFFLIGGLPCILWVEEKGGGKAPASLRRLIRTGFSRTRETWDRRRTHRELFRFIGAYIVFNIGVYGVIGFAGIYARKIFGLEQDEIILTFIVSQVAAAGGALLTSPLSRRFGCVKTVAFTLLIWILAGVLGLVVEGRTGFWAVAMLAGVGIGATLPSARAVIGLFAPEERAAEFFGFWGVGARIAGILAAGGNWIVIEITGSLRAGIAYFTVSFIVGAMMLLRVDEERGIAEARNP